LIFIAAGRTCFLGQKQISHVSERFDTRIATLIKYEKNHLSLPFSNRRFHVCLV
jgi:hypothetical protein